MYDMSQSASLLQSTPKKSLILLNAKCILSPEPVTLSAH